MESIFLDYQDKRITGDSKLQEEYARRKEVNKDWVHCTDITIHELINNILDEFEEAGFDLNTLPIENVLSRFVAYEPEIKIPKEYIQLQDAKNLIETQLAATEESEHTINAIASMKSTLNLVNEAIKGYK